MNVACVDKCVNDTDCFLDQCQISECQLQGKAKVCNHTVKICPTRTCSSVSCDPGTGCVFTPFPEEFCNDFNECTNDTCVEGVGCTHTNITCPINTTNLCEIATCVPGFACVRSAKLCPRAQVCLGDQTSCDFERQSKGECNCTLEFKYLCSIASCNETSGLCEENEFPCGGISTVEVAIGIGVAAIIGIIIALAVCIGLSGGGAYGAYVKYAPEGEAKVENNPIYKGNMRGGENPLARS
jgi:hypothetical protein